MLRIEVKGSKVLEFLVQNKKHSLRKPDRGKVVDNLFKALTNLPEEVGITTSEVYEGGSVKQGTAVPGHYDIDLVLFSKDLTSEECIRERGYKTILNKIDEYLKKQFGDRYKKRDIRPVTLEFSFREPKGEIIVKLSLSRDWKPSEELFKTLEKTDSQEIRELFIPGRIKEQTAFIKCVDKDNHPKGNHRVCQNIHHLIKRAKLWKNKEDWKHSKEKNDKHDTESDEEEEDLYYEPSSYLIALLVISAHNHVTEKYGEYGPKHADFMEYTKRVTEQFKNLVKQLGKKEDFGPIPFVAKDKELRAVRRDYAHLLPAPWWLIDPANPANNVYVSGMSGKRKDRGWQNFAENVDNIDLTTDVQKILTKK